MSKEEKEDITIDFSKITKFFKRKRSNNELGNEKRAPIDFNRIKSFSKKYSPFLLILIPIFFAIFFRAYPVYLPVTDDWAENSINSNIKNGVLTQINQQYPNLPDVNKQKLADEQLKLFLEENSGSLESQKRELSDYFKSKFQDDSGQTYLLAIDPYFYYRHTMHYLDSQQAGTIYTDDIVNQEAQKLMYRKIDFSKNHDWDYQRLAPVGSPTKMTFHSYVGVYLHKFLSLFNSNQSVLASFFLIPIIISALAIIPGFLIGRKIGGNIGGFVSGMVLATNTAFLGRTAGGFSDTDPYNVFFPLLIVWLFLEAMTVKDFKKKATFSILAGLSVGLYSFAWSGWWYIFDFLLAGIGTYFLYLIFKNRKKNILKNNEIKSYFSLILIFLISSGIFTSLFNGFKTFFNSILQPINFLAIKDVATTNLWPTILTTVAELNSASFNQVVSAVGGKMFFWLAVIGILVMFFLKSKDKTLNIKTSILLSIWFIGTIYASTKGMRFILLLVPAFAVAFGSGIGVIFQKVSNWLSSALKIDKNFSKVLFIIIILLMLIQPLKAANSVAKSEIPSMNDAWFNTLTNIKENTPEDSIINSWWDFGHWFITLADRKVTFDGGGQDKHMAHWIGKSLLVNDEKKTSAILRMVDCGNNNAFWALDKEVNDSPKSIDILNEIIMLNKESAKKRLLEFVSEEKSEEVLGYTHCSAPDNYYITSSDMVGKAGVWAHFGSWDFNKALMYQQAKKMNGIEGPKYLEDNFNLSVEESNQIYYEIHSTDADRWVAPWPNYVSSLRGCSKKGNETISCINVLGGQQTVQFEIDLNTMDASLDTQPDKIFPVSIVYNDNESITEKKFENSQFPYSIALIKEGENYQSMLVDPALASSTFTKLFFFNGVGMNCFNKFSEETQVSGGKISVWKVDWDCLE